jgi:hypothetical protein
MTPPYTPGGYGHALETLLAAAGVASQHAGGEYGGGQCGDTREGLVCTNTTGGISYLTVEGVFDLCHFNYGLHDLANYSAALPRLPLPQYAQNLLTIYKRLQTKCKLVMWTSTTPVPDVPTSYGRTYELPIQYNAEALKVLTSAAPAGKLLINDLWSHMIKFCGDHYKSCLLQLPANVHLTEAGINFTAHSAAEDILAALR